jgi:hypothetical protein
MDSVQLEELERLAKAATPGPWKDKSFKRNYDWGVICSGGKRIAQCTSADVTDERKRVTFEEKLANAAYIAAACNAVPELIAENRKFQECTRELSKQNDFFLKALKENFMCPYSRCKYDDGSELQEWDCTAYDNRECWITAAKEAGE